MAQPYETFLACVRPKFQLHGVSLDKLYSNPVRYYKTRGSYQYHMISNALFRGDFHRNWNNDYSAQMLINTGIVKYFIEKCGETPKLKKYKKYGSIGAQSVRVCMESIIAIAHSPFFTCEYYSKLSPLWQEIAHKVKPTYKVVLRTAVDNLATPAGIHWRPIILPNFYKHLVNSETEVYDDISIMPWHSYPNVNIMQKELRTTDSLPCVACHAATQTDVSLAVVVPTAEEVQTDSEPTKELNLTKFLPRNNHKSEVRSYEILKAFNKLMESELRQYASADENNNVRKRRQTASLTTNQWFPVVLLERSKSIESLLTLNQTQDLAAKRQKRNSMSRYGH